MRERLEEIRRRLQQQVDPKLGVAEVIKAYKMANSDRKFLLAELEKIENRDRQIHDRVKRLEDACTEAVQEMEAFDLRQSAWDSCRRALSPAKAAS